MALALVAFGPAVHARACNYDKVALLDAADGDKVHVFTRTIAGRTCKEAVVTVAIRELDGPELYSETYRLDRLDFESEEAHMRWLAEEEMKNLPIRFRDYRSPEIAPAPVAIGLLTRHASPEQAARFRRENVWAFYESWFEGDTLLAFDSEANAYVAYETFSN
jgi:hypothetical protein